MLLDWPSLFPWSTFPMTAKIKDYSFKDEDVTVTAVTAHYFRELQGEVAADSRL